LKLIKNLANLISEGSKLKILKDKLGLSDFVAAYLDSKYGKLSIWIANKLIDDFLSNHPGDTPLHLRINHYREDLVGLLDYIRVGLNGNISSIKDYNLYQLFDAQKKWHDQLQIGSGKINYDETNKVILDFRNSDGLGYYWVDLDTTYSPEECDRMGHCGRASENLYSLRSFEKISDKFTLNKSHITTSISDDGTVTQMKGPKNSKPSVEFHKYILPLFQLKNDDLVPDSINFIERFRCTYRPETDFQIWDLSKEDLMNLISLRPDLFDGLYNRYKLFKLGLIEVNPFDQMQMWFDFKIETDDIERYVDGDWVVRQIKDKGRFNSIRKIGMFETILSGDMWDVIEYNETYELSDLLADLNDINKNKIWNLINETANENSLEEIPTDLEEAIESVEEFIDIKQELNNARNDCYSNETYDKYYETLKSCLEFYGDVLEMNDEGVVIRVSMKDNIESLSDSELQEIINDFMDNIEHPPASKKSESEQFLERVFDYFTENVWRKPKFQISDYWYPYCKNSEFNSHVFDKLGDL
jgi:hypothetical protein